jgi:hypothetical protein
MDQRECPTYVSPQGQSSSELPAAAQGCALSAHHLMREGSVAILAAKAEGMEGY